MAAFADLVRFVPTAGGTAAWTFASAVGGCQSPTAANVQNGIPYKLYAVSSDLTQWEVCASIYNSATGTFPRTTVLYNSAGTGTAAGQSGAGTPINFATVPQVSVVALAEDLPSLTAPNAFTDTTASISPVTGALIVAGGVGVGGNINVGGTITLGVAGQNASLQVGVGGTGANFATIDINGGSGNYGGGQFRLMKNSVMGWQLGYVSALSSGTNSDFGIVSDQATGGAAFVLNISAATGVMQVSKNTAAPAGGSAAACFAIGSDPNFGIYFGSGVPTVAASKGSLYIRTDGSSTSTRMYVNTNGSTTWTNVGTAA